MERVKFDLKLNNERLLDVDKSLKRKKEITTSLDLCHGDDDRGKYFIPVIKYNIFNDYEDMYHGFSTRIGGVSKEHLSTLNLSFSRGDDVENVKINHERFAKAVGYSTESLVFSDQVHNSNIRCVTADDIGKGYNRESDITDTDGLLTNQKGITLMTFYADCVPNYFYDPVKKVVGLAHSGWKGTVRRIGSAMIELMNKTYGSNPSDIICAIGPSICRDCYEVSKDVYEEFESVYDKNRMNSVFTHKKNNKYQLDLQLACKYNLIDAGVLPENIALPDLCTCCNKNLLYSHRGSNGKRGNLAAVIGLK